MDFLSPQCANTSIGVANSMIIHLVSALLTNYCNTSPNTAWPDDFGPQALQKGNDTYDFIVIGAGSAGSVLANRLSEDPTQKVLLIEAGMNPPIESEVPGFNKQLQGTIYDWFYSTETNGISCLARVNNDCFWPRGKMLGGSSGLNGMLYVRGNSRDYNRWEELGNPSWNWDTVLKYFKLSEHFNGDDPYNVHGRHGPLNVEAFRTPSDDQNRIIQAAKESGYDHVDDFNAGNRLGFGFLYGTVKNGRRFSAAKAYLRVKRDNLNIIKNAVATKINFDVNKRAESVTFVINQSNELTMTASKEIILSGGSIESPKLLMLSGIGPKDHLQSLRIPIVKDASVGDNLQDHATVQLFVRLVGDAYSDSENLDAIYDEWVHSKGRLNIALYNVGGFVNTRQDSPFPDLEYVFLASSNVDTITADFKDNIRDSIRKQFGPKDRLLVLLVAVLNPKARGKIRLASSQYKDKPIIIPNYFDDEEDIRTMVDGIKRIVKFEQTQTFKKWRAKLVKVDLPECDKFEYMSDEYWACYAKYMTTTIYHPVGSVKMGPSSDPEAVVDQNLRVYGVTGLRVIDASIMPNIVSGNTNAPTIMLAEKAVDSVKDQWKITGRKS